MAKTNSTLSILNHPDYVVHVSRKVMDENMETILAFCEQASGEYWCGYDSEARTTFYFNLIDTAFEFKMRFG
jgi:hypothetical protein